MRTLISSRLHGGWVQAQKRAAAAPLVLTALVTKAGLSRYGVHEGRVADYETGLPEVLRRPRIAKIITPITATPASAIKK